MIDLGQFKKGEKKGKTIGIFNPTKNAPYKTTNMPAWQETWNLMQYLKNYVGYDNVYILRYFHNDSRYQKTKQDYPYVYNIKNLDDAIKDIDEMVQLPDGLVLWGGVSNVIYYYNCLFINAKRNDETFRLYFYEQDPEFTKYNFVKAILQRKNIKFTYNIDDKYKKIYDNDLNDILSYIDDNTIILYNGTDIDEHIQKSNGDINNAKYYKPFKINEYSFANNFDFNKILTNIKFDKKYKFGYYGGPRKDTVRNKIISNLLQDIDNSVIIGGIKDKIKLFNDTSKFDVYDTIAIPELYYFLSDNIKTSLFITDVSNWNNFKSFRFFENLLLDFVGFIYYKQDINKTYIENQELKDFIYVNEEDFIDKVNKVTNDKTLYCKLIYLQRLEFYNQMKDYMKDENKKLFEEWLDSNKHI